MKKKSLLVGLKQDLEDVQMGLSDMQLGFNSKLAQLTKAKKNLKVLNDKLYLLALDQQKERDIS